jgi:hypothetical protein
MTVAYSDLTPGTPITWQDSGGSFNMTLNGLATSGIRQGPKSASLIDATKGFPEVLRVKLLLQFNTSPTAGAQVGLFLGWSESATAGTDNSGGMSGTDAALSDANALNSLTAAGWLSAQNNNGTNQQVVFDVKPLGTYVMPALDNESGVSLKASANVTVITITPMYRTAPRA